MRKEDEERREINYKEEDIRLLRKIKSKDSDKRVYKLIERLYLKEEGRVKKRRFFHASFCL